MVPLFLTASLIQWFIPIKLELDKQAQAEQFFKGNGFSVHHWPSLDTDSPGGGSLMAADGVMAWKKTAINSFKMGFLSDVVCLEMDNPVPPFKGDLQLAAVFKNLRILTVDFSRTDLPRQSSNGDDGLGFIRKLKELRCLCLSNYSKEDIKNTFTDSKDDFSFLKILSIQQCPHFSGEAIPKIFSFRSMLSLDISGCDLRSIPEMDAREPFKMRHLELKCKKLDKNIWKYVANCPDLEDLTISNAEFSGKELEMLSGLKKLTKLKIYQSALTDQDLVYLVHFKKLEVLKFGGNNLTDQGVQHIVQLGELNNLKLAGEKISDACLTDLKKLVKLQTICLSETGITKQGESTLNKFRDGIKITKINLDLVFFDDFLDQSDFPSLFHLGPLWRKSTPVH